MEDIREKGTDGVVDQSSQTQSKMTNPTKEIRGRVVRPSSLQRMWTLPVIGAAGGMSGPGSGSGANAIHTILPEHVQGFPGGP